MAPISPPTEILPELEPCGQWDGLSPGAPWGNGRGYFARGHHSRFLFSLSARKGWLDDAVTPVEVRHGHLRYVPTYHREQHPQLGLLEYRGTRLVPAPGPGRGAFPATWWWGTELEQTP